MDDFAEHEPWLPYYGADGDPLKNYPETPCYTVSCFISQCKLCVIINDIILGLYSGRKPESVGLLVRNNRHQLDLWWATLPAHLRIDTSNIPAILPPPHIISLKWVYYFFLFSIYILMVIVSCTTQASSFCTARSGARLTAVPIADRRLKRSNRLLWAMATHLDLTESHISCRIASTRQRQL